MRTTAVVELYLVILENTTGELDVTLYVTIPVTIGFISLKYKLSYLECMSGAVVTPSGQSVNQSVYMKSVCQRHIAIADTYRAEENTAIY